jgi:hypothetical protein
MFQKVPKLFDLKVSFSLTFYGLEEKNKTKTKLGNVSQEICFNQITLEKNTPFYLFLFSHITR